MRDQRSNLLKLLLVELLLLSPLAIYVASYLVVVRPQGGYYAYEGMVDSPVLGSHEQLAFYGFCHYRWGGERAAWFFYPLEQADRTIRPAAWPAPTDPSFYFDYERVY